MRAGEGSGGDLGGGPRGQARDAQALTPPSLALSCSKTLQRNRKMAMGRKKFNMDPKKVLGPQGRDQPGRQTSRQRALAPLGSRSAIVQGLPEVDRRAPDPWNSDTGCPSVLRTLTGRPSLLTFAHAVPSAWEALFPFLETWVW